jgi:phospholipid/cholesterol/gamma-HCH transport system substrate-binding protein
MESKVAFRKIAAGLFFVVCLVLIVISIFIIGVERGMSQPKFQVIALFNQVDGLVEGAPIRISGINVGVVGGVNFLDEPIEGRSLKVTLNIFKKYEFQFRKCSRVSIKTEGVLGQKLIEISEDHSRKLFDLSEPIIGEDPLDVQNMAGVIIRTASSLQKTSENISYVVNQWKYISHKTRRLINRVEDKIVEGNLFKLF